jgi:hypothetical protein
MQEAFKMTRQAVAAFSAPVALFTLSAAADPLPPSATYRNPSHAAVRHRQGK